METQELNIIPISMRCTQEQYKSIKPILDANGISNDFVFSYADTFLVTNYSDDIVVMNTLSIDAEKFGRTLFTEWDEKIFLKCLGIETKELKVGDYIRGFKYDCHEGLEYRMNSHIGQIAIIVEILRGLIKVEFEDNSTWYYPHNLAIEHLVDPLEETPFHKPDFSHLLDVDKILEKGIKNSGLNDKPIEELEEHFKEDPKLFSILLSKGKDRRIVIDQTKEQIDLLVDASKGWHVIVIEQQQDKGIQIVIKS